jgi:hypothetical protein
VSLVFPPSAKVYGRVALALVIWFSLLTIGAVWYYGTPKYTRVGYQPNQPINFSHAQHVGELGMDCRACHNHVEESPHANVPDLQTCMNCHGTQYGNIKGQADSLAALRTAFGGGAAVRWNRLHQAPDYAYFNHAVHVRRGVSCVECHGQINEMEIVRHDQPLTMGWCLECHRDPIERLRPADKVTDLDWRPDDAARHEAFLKYMEDEVGINPPVNCTGCHR